MHSNHVAQRNQRVEKYGSSVVADGNKGMSPGSRGGGYAMFSTPLSSGGVGVGAGNRLAAKYGGEAGKNSSKAGPPDFEGSKRQVGTKPPPTGGGAKVRGSTVECTGANTSPGPLTYPVIRSTMTRRNHTQAHTHSNTPGPGGPSLSSGITAPTSNYNTPTPQLQHQRYRKNATSEAAEQVEATLAKVVFVVHLHNYVYALVLSATYYYYYFYYTVVLKDLTCLSGIVRWGSHFHSC